MKLLVCLVCISEHFDFHAYMKMMIMLLSWNPNSVQIFSWLMLVWLMIDVAWWSLCHALVCFCSKLVGWLLNHGVELMNAAVIETLAFFQKSCSYEDWLLLLLMLHEVFHIPCCCDCLLKFCVIMMMTWWLMNHEIDAANALLLCLNHEFVQKNSSCLCCLAD